MQVKAAMVAERLEPPMMDEDVVLAGEDTRPFLAENISSMARRKERREGCDRWVERSLLAAQGLMRTMSNLRPM